MTNYYQCDECRKTSPEHELVWVGEEWDGSPVCPHCWGFVSYAFEAVDQPEPDLGDDLEEADHWDMIKASVFIILFIIWACFAAWGHYVS